MNDRHARLATCPRLGRGWPRRVVRVRVRLQIHVLEDGDRRADGNLDALRALRHKLHSALTQLRLEALRHAFDAFLEAPDQETARALTAHELDRAAASLRQAAARENPSDHLPPPQSEKLN